MYYSSGNQPLYAGYIACFISVVFFGSNLALIKKHNTGDGFFFNWVYCSAIWIIGLIVNMIEGSPQFYPLAMVGGLLWATGGLCVSLILRCIGLGLGVCIWATFNLIIGWACGRFGLFGLHPRLPQYEALNYLACLLSVVSAVFYLSVKTSYDYSVETQPLNQVDLGPENTNDSNFPTTTSTTTTIANEDTVSCPPSPTSLVITLSSRDHEVPDQSLDVTSIKSKHQKYLTPIYTFIDGGFKLKKRLIGSLLAIFAGCLFGVNFVPVIYIQDNYPKSSNKGLPYIFAHFSGIYAAATIYFFIYCLCKSGKPWINSALIVPTMISGAMWAVATCAWFVANEILTQTISFPIIASLPPIIAGFWGLLVFKEIHGKRNIILLMIAFFFSLCGAILSGLSF